MQTIQLQIDDNKLDTVLTVIENLKDGIVKNITIKSDGLDKETKAYMDTEQFQEDKAYFQQCYNDIKSGKTELLDDKQYHSQMDSFIDGLKSKYADN